MSRTGSTVEQKLAAADAQVADAQSRLAGLRLEQREIAIQLDQAEEATRRAQYDAAAAGTRYDASTDRAAAERLQQHLVDLGPVESALSDAVTKAEHERERIIFEAWPSLADSLEERARAVVRERNALAERHAAELAAQRRAERGVLDEWGDLIGALPTIFRPRISGATLAPERRPDEADDGGLAAFVAEESWPSWAHDALARARSAEQARRDRDVTNVPVA
jgi:hypothetical protein